MSTYICTYYKCIYMYMYINVYVSTYLCFKWASSICVSDHGCACYVSMCMYVMSDIWRVCVEHTRQIYFGSTCCSSVAVCVAVCVTVCVAVQFFFRCVRGASAWIYTSWIHMYVYVCIRVTCICMYTCDTCLLTHGFAWYESVCVYKMYVRAVSAWSYTL